MFNEINKKAQEAGIEAQDEFDSLGGSLLESGVYPFEFDTVYFTQSEKGAMAYNVLMKINGATVRDTVYFTNRDGEIFYDDGKGNKKASIGWNKFTALCKLFIGADPATFDDKTTTLVTLDLWDKDQGKPVPTEVSVIKKFTGVKGMVAVKKVRTNKQKADDSGKYNNTNEERILNEFDKFFDEKGFTLAELEAKKEEPAFLGTWKAKFEGELVDNFKEVKGAAKTGSKAGAFRKPAAKTSTDAAGVQEEEGDDDLFA